MSLRCTALSLTLLLMLPAVAHAAEGQWGLGAGVGAGLFDGLSRPGPRLSLTASRGLTDSWLLGVEVSGARARAASQTFWPLQLEGHLDWRLDVIQWIPYLGAGVGLRELAGLPVAVGSRSTDLVLSGRAGLERALSRSWALDLHLAYGAGTLGALDGEPQAQLTVMLGAQTRWGW